jgi:hypothetical protein
MPAVVHMLDFWFALQLTKYNSKQFQAEAPRRDIIAVPHGVPRLTATPVLYHLALSIRQHVYGFACSPLQGWGGMPQRSLHCLVLLLLHAEAGLPKVASWCS